MKKVSSFSVKLLFSISFTLALLEVGLRLFPAVIPLPLLYHFNSMPRSEVARSRSLSNKWDIIYLDRDDGGPTLWIYRPLAVVQWPVKDENAVLVRKMDDLGFCNPPERSYHLPKIDLIALGDSFTTCYAVNPEDTWSSQLATLTGLSTYNLGRIGMGWHSEIQILKNFGLQKSPRLVILNVYEGNDLRDGMNFYRYRQNQTAAQPASGGANLRWKLTIEELLGHYSYAFNLALACVRYWQNSTPNRSSTEASTTAEAGPESEFAHDSADFRYDLVFGDKVIPFNPKNEDLDEVQHAMTIKNRLLVGEQLIGLVMEEPLATLVELGRQYGFTPVVTYTPSAYTAYAANTAFKDPTLAEIMTEFSRYQREFLKNESKKLGFIFIDLTPALQAAAQSGGPDHLLYFPYNRHLTPAGHTVIATELGKTLPNLAVVSR